MVDNKTVSLINEMMNTKEFALYMTNEEGAISVWNKAAEELFGYTAQEILGKSEKTFFPDHLEKVLHDGMRYTWRIRKNGSSVFIKESVLKIVDSDEPLFCYMKMAEDYSDHLTAQEKSELWLTQYERVNWGVAISDLEKDNLQLMNKQFATMHGFTEEELQGKPLATVFSSEAQKDIPTHEMITAMNGRHQFRSEHVRKDGSKFPVIIDTTAICDHQGKVVFEALQVRAL